MTASIRSKQASFLGWNSLDLVMRYYHNSDLQMQCGLSTLSKYGPLLGNEKILDFGSGDGKISAIISKLVPKGTVTAVDLSPHMSEFASAFYDCERYPNLSFHVLQDPNFDLWKENEIFNLALSFNVLHLVRNPKTVLQNISKRLTPKGHFVGTWPVSQSEEGLQYVIDVAKNMDLAFHYQIMNKFRCSKLKKFQTFFARQIWK